MSILPKNLLFHQLKGVYGWSHLSIIRIDIGRIISIEKHKRLFKIRDKCYDYTLLIHYDKSTHWTGIAPVLGGGASFYNYIDESQMISKRYKTEKDIDNEIKELYEKLEKLEKYRKKISKKILE